MQEYDPSTDRFVGFCLPLNDGLSICNAFILNTFEEIKEAVENKTISKYAHCIVAQPVDGIAPESILFVLGTDSKYTHELIIERWNFIEKELLKRDIKVISNGADGAGPCTKAMLPKSGILQKLLGTYLRHGHSVSCLRYMKVACQHKTTSTYWQR